MAVKNQSARVSIYIETGDAQKHLDTLTEKQHKLNEELAKTTTHPKRIKAINEELKKMEEPIERARKKLSGELLPTMRDLQISARRWMNEFERTGDPAALAKIQRINLALGEQRRQMNSLTDAHRNLAKSEAPFTSMMNVAKGFLVAGTVEEAGRRVIGFLKDGVNEFFEAQEKIEMLEMSLENMGAGDALDQFLDKSQLIADQFRFIGDDDVVEIFTKLNDLGKLTRRQMFEVSPLLVDLAAKLKTDLPTATDVFINSINGKLSPQLKRLGIDFKDSHSFADRLQIVMDVLNEKVKGTGETFANTYKGKMQVYKQGIKDIKEDLGEFTVNAIPNLNEGVTSFAINFLDLFQPIDRTIDKLIEKATFYRKLSGGDITKAAKSLLDGGKAEKAIIDEQNKRDDQDQRDAEAKRNAERAAMERERIAKEKAAAEKLEKDFFQKIRELDEDFHADEFQRDILRAGRERDALIKEATEKIKDKDQLNKQLHLIDELYWKKVLEITDKHVAEDKKKYDQAAKEKAISIAKAYELLGKELEKLAKRTNADRLAFNELKILQTQGKERLTWKLHQLEEERKLELKNKELTASQIDLIEERYRQARAKLNMEFEVEKVQQIIGFAQQALSIFSTINVARSEKENQELERDRYINDQKRVNLDRRLKAGAISQKQYDLEIQKIERDQQKRERVVRQKQFEREKQAALIQALINGALAVTNIWATTPKADFGISTYIMLGLSAIATLSSVASIASRKAPEFARGGKLGGRSHSEGGNPILDGQGRKIAEIEKGEGIINKHSMSDRKQYTVSGTPSQIASMINSMSGTGVSWDPGGRLLPAWYTRRPAAFNFGAINKYYATGGTFGSAGAGSSEVSNDQQLRELILSFSATLERVNSRLSEPLVAYTSLSDFETQQERMNAIRDDATLKA